MKENWREYVIRSIYKLLIDVAGLNRCNLDKFDEKCPALNMLETTLYVEVSDC